MFHVISPCIIWITITGLRGYYNRVNIIIITIIMIIIIKLIIIIRSVGTILGRSALAKLDKFSQRACLHMSLFPCVSMRVGRFPWSANF